jgi:hypothetical protein
MDPLDALGMVAHPDDAQLFCGGALIRVTFGEPFWTRETMAVDTLGGFPVSTF